MKKVFFTLFACLLMSSFMLLNTSSVYGQTTVNLPATKDNGIFNQSGALSTGIGGEIIMGRTNGGDLRRALMEFDVSSIPANATITDVKVKLQMTRTQAGPEDVAMHKMTSTWGEGTSDGGTGSGSGQGATAATNDATWSHAFYNTTTWTTAGGDYTASASATMLVDGLASYTYTGTGLVADVQAWITSGATNFGWMFIGDEVTNKTTKHWATRENTTVAFRPDLEIIYTMPAATPLSGIYTIGGVGADYATFTAAVTDLATLGVSGAVTFNVAPGIYSEFLSLTEVTGASATNTITFNGVDKSLVALTHDGTTQEATVAFDGADYFTFKNIAVVNTKITDDAWGFHFRNQADDNTIDSCSVTMATLTAYADIICIVASSSLTASTSGSDNFNNLTISNSDLIGGYYGVRTEASGTNDTGIVVMNCILQDNIGSGISIDEAKNVTITGNKVFGLGLSSKDGLNFDDIIDFTITGNTSDVDDYALEIDDGNFDSSPTGRSIIANNMLISSGDEGMNLDDVVDVDVFHNTVVTTSTSSSGYGLFINDDAGLDIRNNIFIAAAGPAIYLLDASSDATIDYNIYSSTGTNVAYDGTSSHTTLASWQSAQATRNVNSIVGNPVFVSATDLHVASTSSLANDVGDNTVGIMTDIDGETRPLAPSTTVDIGADEYAYAAPANPVVQFNSTAISVDENAGTITITVDVSNVNATATSIDVVVDATSTATSGMDYTFTSPTTLTFPGGSTTSQTVTVTIVDDAMEELLPETIVFNLSNATNNAAVGANSVYTITINPSDISFTKDLLLTGFIDGPSGNPKAVEIYVLNNVADLSKYGVGVANNGGGTNGIEFSFPAVSATAGDFIYIANDTTGFFNFFGIHAEHEDSDINFNGDDAVELFENGFVIDVFGDINVDGTGTPWEYQDTWAYRNCSTGLDSTVFQLGNWSFAPINNFDNQTSNATSPVPMPVGTYSIMCPLNPIAMNDIATTPMDSSITIDVLANDNVPNVLTSLTIFMQGVNGTATANGTMDITYVPNTGFCGTNDTFTYVMCDAVGCDTADVVVTVNCLVSVSNSMTLTALYDGPYSGGKPKGVEVYIVNNIADLSLYGIGTANNGGGTDGQEYTFPAVSATAGTFLYVTNDSTGFADFFGFNADFIDTQSSTGGAAAMTFNGDDAVEIYEQGVIIDLFGDPNNDGTGTAWEYLDTWVYRNCSTGPDTAFVVGDWTYSPINNFDGAASNATATLPMPIGTYTAACAQVLTANDDVIEVPFNTATTFMPLSNDNIPSALISGGIVQTTMNGTITLNLITTEAIYTPNTGFCGTDMGTYEICDANGCDTAMVTFNIACLVPSYDIATVVTVDADGNADSLDVVCELQGIVYGIDFDGNAGYSFTLIDATDGINVFNFVDVASGYTVTEGDEIRVVGKIEFYNGLTEILVDTIEFISAGNALKTPTIVTTLGENTESDLIKVEAVTLVDPTQWDATGANSFNVDVRNTTDTITIRIDSDCDIAGTAAPVGWFNVTGLGGQFDNSSPYTDGYQIFPRYQADIELITNTNTPANLSGQIRMFPNPTSGFLNIVSEINIENIRISNVLGQEVMTVQSPNATTALNVSNLTQGVYIITFITENGTWTEQFVKN